jgi:hypothetical protein
MWLQKLRRTSVPEAGFMQWPKAPHFAGTLKPQVFCLPKFNKTAAGFTKKVHRNAF